MPDSKRVAIIATDYFEEAELVEPLKALRDAGLAVEVLAPHEGTIKALRHVEPGESVTVDRVLAEASPAEYDALVLPGGAINADKLRMDENAQEFARQILLTEKPLAAICHAPWLLVSADLVKGRHLTSYPTLQVDIKNAGGSWTDEQVVVDGNLITSRKPEDIPAFNRALLAQLQQPPEKDPSADAP
jgi:deglycase